jgi:hypothetical protein
MQDGLIPQWCVRSLWSGLTSFGLLAGDGDPGVPAAPAAPAASPAPGKTAGQASGKKRQVRSRRLPAA